MRLPNENDERAGLSSTVISAIVAVTLFVGAILIVVLMMNTSQEKNSKAADRGQMTANASQAAESEKQNKDTVLSPSEFDFWDMYPEETQELPAAEEGSEAYNENVKETENDPATDGKHTQVTTADGKEEWVLISPYLPKHEYDFTKLVCQSDLMKYYEEGRQVSYVGADISKYQDYVDFVKLKKSGIDFVMLRVGARGYGSGQIVLDEYFSDNIKRATDAGLNVGVYFFSQAVTEAEAVEEANIVLESVKDYKLTYPVAFDMEHIENDTARIDGLTKAEKTSIAKAFLDTVKAAGYIPMLYGNKEWLIKEIDMSKLTAYDIWLSQLQDVPDYPYKFSMWQYTTEASVDGIAGYANLNISFIDYSEK